MRRVFYWLWRSIGIIISFAILALVFGGIGWAVGGEGGLAVGLLVALAFTIRDAIRYDKPMLVRVVRR